MKEKKEKLKYEKPCLYDFNDYKNGKGISCYGLGSGNTDYCANGNSASGEGCIAGNSASVSCSTGNNF
jgi:hypothetical protein